MSDYLYTHPQQVTPQQVEECCDYAGHRARQDTQHQTSSARSPSETPTQAENAVLPSAAPLAVAAAEAEGRQRLSQSMLRLAALQKQHGRRPTTSTDDAGDRTVRLCSFVLRYYLCIPGNSASCSCACGKRFPDTDYSVLCLNEATQTGSVQRVILIVIVDRVHWTGKLLHQTQTSSPPTHICTGEGNVAGVGKGRG